MPSLKPAVIHPHLRPNKLGLTIRDYEGSPSTLCAGCGHDSVTAAIVRSFYELDTPPHMIAKLSGIGCSSKTPTYFVGGAHGFNSAHGRMPSIATGANAANRSLTYIGISGDGDSLSIGIGQLVHAIRRNLDMLYVIENNGVYGLTKGQFSASADVGTKSKRGEANQFSPIDPVSLALELGAELRGPRLLRRQGAAGPDPQGGPLAQGVRAHRRHLALRDLQRPRGLDQELPQHAQEDAADRERRLRGPDFVPPAAEITADYPPGSAVSVQLHDGSTVRLRKLAEDYDTGDRQAAAAEVERHRAKGEVPTGLFFVDPKSRDMHDICGTTEVPLSQIPFEKLCPGSAALDELQKTFR